MFIVGDLSAEVPDTNAFHWNLKELSKESNDMVLMYGYNSSANTFFHQYYQNFKRKIYFNNWAPCEFAQHKDHHNKTPMEYDLYFNEIYSICPYSNRWLNSLGFDRQYKNIFYPFHQNLIPKHFEKEYDIIYHGGIHGEEHIDCLQVMLSFNYRYCTMTNHINQLTVAGLKYATNVNLSFQEKINLIAKSKISVCYNFVHISPENIPEIQKNKNWNENEAFNEVGKWNIMPQFKTRMHEAAISKTLNLVMRDKWNIAERYYEPDKEFIYFDNKDDLNNKIKQILADWEAYQEIIDNAYNRAMNYTTDKFINLIKSGEQWR